MKFEQPLDRTCIFFDVDGSLIDIAARPDEVVVPETLLRDLKRTEGVLKGAIALISGRSVEQLDHLFRPERFRASGVHGAEVRFEPDDATAGSDADVIPAPVWDELASVLHGFPGTFAENKKFSYAIHYRAAPDEGERLNTELRALIERHSGLGLRLMPGHFVIELKRQTFNKGLAIRRFMSHPRFAGRRPIFIGDDVTDMPGFAAAIEFGGDAYSVGTRLPGTTGHFEAPSDVRRWVAQIAEMETATV